MTPWIYDLEVFGGNFFCGTFMNVKTKEIIQCYKSNDVEYNIDKLYDFINNNFLVGYNNLNYDDIILNFINKYKEVNTKSIYILSNEIINSQKTGTPIWKNETIKPYLRGKIKSLDMMKILAFDKLKVGLKQCAVNLRHELIQDLPFKPSYRPVDEDLHTILRYNINDIHISYKLFIYVLDLIELRINYSKEYKVDVLNASKTYIGKETLNKYYADYTGLDYYEFKDLRSYRDRIIIKDCISDKVKYKTNILNKMLDYFKSYSVSSIDEGIDYLVLFNNKGYQMGFGGLDEWPLYK